MRAFWTFFVHDSCSVWYNCHIREHEVHMAMSNLRGDNKMSLQNYAYFGLGAFGLVALVGCGSVTFGGGSEAATQDQTQDQEQEQAQDASASKSEAPKADFDCDALMQQLADNCFTVTAFEADGKTPLQVTDEAGNAMGEVDQAWAKDYCECYAGLAFQTFGCETVITHQNLSDEEYDKLYSPIIASCEEVPVEGAPDANAPEANGHPANSGVDANGNLVDGEATDLSLRNPDRPVDDSAPAGTPVVAQ